MYVSPNQKSRHWEPTSSPRHRRQIVHLSIRTPLRVQDTGNKSYNSAPLRATDTGNKSYILAPDPNYRSRHQQQIVHRSAGAQDTGNTSYILAIGLHFEAKISATHRTAEHWDPASSPRHRQHIVHLSTGAPLQSQDSGNKSSILAMSTPLRAQNTGNKSYTFSIGTPLRAQDTGNNSYILAPRPHFEPKTPATNRNLSTGAPLRARDTGNKSNILAMGHQPKTAATNRTS